MRDVTLQSGGDVPVAFEPVLLPAGRVRGAISTDHDALAADDSFHFAFTADDAVHVLLVLPDDAAPEETMFLERALAVGRSPAIRVDRARSYADRTAHCDKRKKSRRRPIFPSLGLQSRQAYGGAIKIFAHYLQV